MKVLINSKIVTNGTIIRNRNIIFDNKIIDITKTLPEQAEVINANGHYVSSGFIDRHIHGISGKDVMDADIHALDVISRNIVRTGVTDFVPTTMTMDLSHIKNVLSIIKSYKGHESGAEIIGVHLEGPFINPNYKGAQKENFIIKPSFDIVENNIDVIKLITYAPEMDKQLTFTKSILNNTNIILSIGHSSCSMDLAVKLFDLGVRNITHCFNRMVGFNHRTPGIIGALFLRNFYIEYIADGIHSDIRMLRGFINKIGTDNSMLITDSMRASMLDTGIYDLGGQRVIADKNSARLEDGTLAGSVLKLNQAVKNIISDKITMPEAIDMVTINPARSLGISKQLGSIKKGKRANLVIFDKNIDIKKVIIKGKIY